MNPHLPDTESRPDATAAKRPRIAVIVEVSSGSGRNILRGISRYSRAHGSWLIHHEGRNTDTVYPLWLDQWAGDGIIARVENDRIAETLLGLGIPVVDVLGEIVSAGFPIVHVDDQAIAETAAEHLLSRGYRSFGFCGIPTFAWSNRRRDAFVHAVGKEGYRCEAHAWTKYRTAGWSWDEEQRTLSEWINRLPKPAGVMVCSDEHALVVLEACLLAGVRVPDEIAVVGVNNDEPICEICEPALSSVVPDDQRVGFEAAQLLDQWIGGAKPPSQTIFVTPTGVKTRLSSDVLAVEDEHVVEAVHYIREHACRGISVEDVVDQVPLCRSLLQRRFRKSLGRTLHDEIMRVRLDQARFLLEEDDMPIHQVAERCGFKDQAYMGAVFKNHVGMTPRQYRVANSNGR